VGAATANGFAPTVSITDNQLAQPGVGVVTATGLAPALDLTITAGLGQVVADGFSPVVTASDHKTASPDVAVVAASALEPTVTATQNQFAAPDVGALTASGFAPQVQISDHQIAAAGLGDVALQGVAPAVAVSDNQRADAQLGALLAAGFAPVVQLPVVVTVGLGQVVATGLEPDAEASTTDIEPRVGVLTIVGFAPNVEIPVTVATASGAAQLAGHAPEVQVLVEVLPEPGEVLAEGFSPSVAIVSEFGEGYWPVVRTMPDGSEVRVGINYPIPNVRTAPKLLRLSLEGWRLRGERLVLNYWTMIRKRPALQAKLLFDDGSPLNLVDARAVSFILNDYDGDELLRAPVEIINHAAAHVRYRPARNDIQQSFRNRGQRAELGHYLAGHFRVDWTDDTFLEWPLTWRFKVEVL
jgi:hypothetical protein